jgi:hypothetical protein
MYVQLDLTLKKFSLQIMADSLNRPCYEFWPKLIHRIDPRIEPEPETRRQNGFNGEPIAGTYFARHQGCQMVANKNLNLGKSWALEWIMLVYFMANWNILRPIGIFYSHLVYIVALYFLPFWYSVPRKIWHPCSRPPKLGF